MKKVTSFNLKEIESGTTVIMKTDGSRYEIGVFSSGIVKLGAPNKLVPAIKSNNSKIYKIMEKHDIVINVGEPLSYTNDGQQISTGKINEIIIRCA
ncbi:MAG: hypothetical protein L6Q29_04015 [Candidatus Pacebacteria bacterium]|nr:hypothetical protein [Candidatus Paceibacterota bacterium]NUQ57297.1 hypothetical protein [Candidatus Paceibacter sp.]